MEKRMEEDKIIIDGKEVRPSLAVLDDLSLYYNDDEIESFAEKYAKEAGIPKHMALWYAYFCVYCKQFCILDFKQQKILQNWLNHNTITEEWYLDENVKSLEENPRHCAWICLRRLEAAVVSGKIQ